MNAKMLLKLTVICGLFGLTACAQSPQTIPLSPEFPAATSAIGQNQPVHIRVSDNRSNKVLGSRGGVYRETAVFTLANELSLAVQPALEKHMKALGYDVDSLSPNTVDLHVLFDKLVYDHPIDGGVGHDMDMLAEVQVQASRSNGDTYQGRYKVKKQQKFFNAPSSSQNQDLVNALVIEVLENMLADPKLVSFLKG